MSIGSMDHFFDKNYFLKHKIHRSYKGLLRLYKKPFLVRLLIKYLPKGFHVLELSCGNAEFTKRLSKIFEVTSLDISIWACKQAEVKGDNTKVVCGDALFLPFQDEKFDGCIALAILEHLKEVDRAINEIKRVIKKDGIFIVEVPNMDSIGIKFKRENWHGYRDESHVSLLTREMWIDMFQRNGFLILEEFGNGLWDVPYFKYIPNFIQYIIIKVPSIILFEVGFRFNLKWRISESIFFVMRIKK